MRQEITKWIRLDDKPVQVLEFDGTNLDQIQDFLRLDGIKVIAAGIPYLETIHNNQPLMPDDYVVLYPSGVCEIMELNDLCSVFNREIPEPETDTTDPNLPEMIEEAEEEYLDKDETGGK